MARVYKVQHCPGSGRLVGRAEKKRRRAEAVEKITVLLSQRRMCAAEIADALQLVKGTAFAYLRFMTSDLRVARKAGALDDQGRELWELGEDPTLPSPEELDAAEDAPSRLMVPARQIGLVRDALVAALFGRPRSEEGGWLLLASCRNGCEIGGKNLRNRCNDLGTLGREVMQSQLFCMMKLHVG